ncbi:MAG: transglutaminase domain-containing protein, partial [Bacteroidetes bacterium]|nr:transglutaminase domain-containing protein [Bacteroidota bacterium]
KRYKGENAPGFPIDTQEFKGIKPYLDPATYIESDDLVLIKAAHDITEGSEDLWDAACKISHWIVENINGSLLAGTARETYDNKSGLCAAQSMLMTALCRAAGIPSRVVWGCMYCHERGGSFGHHAWNEVFMGEAGWVPLDVTSHEADYVDSGHIRLGEVKTLQTIIIYDTMEILDWVGAN